MTARPNGVVRAFLWTFIRVGLQLVTDRTNHLPGLSPDEQHGVIARRVAALPGLGTVEMQNRL
jgi:hypothetical protein